MHFHTQYQGTLFRLVTSCSKSRNESTERLPLPHQTQLPNSTKELTLRPLLGLLGKQHDFEVRYLPWNTIYILVSISGMADYQFQPDVQDPVIKLKKAMDDMDGEYHLLTR